MPASKEQQWKPEEDRLLRDLIKNKFMLKEMPEFFPNRTRRGIECRVSTLGLKSGVPRTRHSKNEKYWEIPNSLNSYYAGWLAADGTISSENRHSLRLTCEITDEPSLIQFGESCKYTGKPRQFLKQSPRSDYIAVHCTLAFSACQKWNEDLKKNFNLFQNKTYRLAPPFLGSDYLMCCYLVGLIDGDGAISIQTKKNEPVIAYGSASKAIVEWFQWFAEENFPFQIRKKGKQIRELLDGEYFHYSVNGMMAVKMIDFLRQLPIPRFPRKWDNPVILAAIQSYKERFPEYFAPDQTLVFNDQGNLCFAS